MVNNSNNINKRPTTSYSKPLNTYIKKRTPHMAFGNTYHGLGQA